jgi:hypothetical protein
MSVKFTLEDFIKKAEETHGDKYDYSKSVYSRALNKLVIICKEHGEFEQAASKHMGGQGCPECKKTKLREVFALTREEFIAQAIKLHGDKYEYEKVNYVNNGVKVIIFCKKHKEDFLQAPGHHINDGRGCPRCGTERGASLQTGITKNILNRMESGAKHLEINSDQYPNAGIYFIENLEDGRKYIGSSVSVYTRISTHKYRLSKKIHANAKLQNAVNKYGIDNFKFEVIELCDAGALLVKEQEYIDKYKCVDEGYNIQKVAGSHIGIKRSEETKRRMSESQKGRVFTEEHKANISKSQIGKTRKIR